ncbi:FKBP-type peptidyl-prolyl cis-trans isomerase N-terminal domain-containing protein [Pedobacter hiemivivus]|uniref:peptidylprolyl isomerase n=1 Tax=Pedobacter hiemivivus TaxID=2530454 RepID=A0A4R0NH39_9SPHI|nr:FKBP-type peptidyl-prolyl cis-trans isomerase N-terminal domain-containing protein [Pedobacter hiemivivus]TCC99508.1 hypothetical protein EZ444_02200 [Pedobacter hiemivivus]
MNRTFKGLMVAMLLFSTNALQAQVRPAQSQTEQQAKDAAFLKKNKTQVGITETASGLQYKVVTIGKGPKPKKFNRVTINYTLRNLEGKIIGSNGNNVWNHKMEKGLYGMEEAMKMMPEGSKWVLYMPASLCKSKYENVPGGRVLECTIELLEVQ